MEFTRVKWGMDAEEKVQGWRKKCEEREGGGGENGKVKGAK
jgi:hypothetical protein